MLRLLKPKCLDSLLHNKRSHCNKRPKHHNRTVAPPLSLENSPHSNEDPVRPKINKYINIFKVTHELSIMNGGGKGRYGHQPHPEPFTKLILYGSYPMPGTVQGPIA